MANQPINESLLASAKYAKFTSADTCYNTSSQQLIFEVDHPSIKARASLQGGQLLECELNGTALLWLSPTAVFDGNTAIRGGIPVCLPWFGVNQDTPSLPKHGFARNSEWQLSQYQESDDHVVFTLSFTSHGHSTFNAPFVVSLTYTLSTQLDVKLTLENTHSESAVFSYALHSYLRVADSETAAVTGLENCTFLDNTDELSEKSEASAIVFTQEIDRVYPACPHLQQLKSGQTFDIYSDSMPTAIVWNPGSSAISVADIGAVYTGYICVERGAAFSDSLTLEAGAIHVANMTIKSI